MGIPKRDTLPESLTSTLTRQFIHKYLKQRGYAPENIDLLPVNTAKELMSDACLYASLKMAQIEACSHFRQKIRVRS
jgi:hypothetical protein